MTSDLGSLQPDPLMLGDHPALEFLNSVFLPAAEPVDLLRDGAGLLRWLRASRVLDDTTVHAASRLDAQALDAAADAARTLREAFRATVARWSAGGTAALRPADLSRLNRAMAAGTLTQRLVAGADGGPPVLRSERAVGGADALVAALAAGCASLLALQPPADVRRCENPACTLWFADTRRGPRRRWCAMALCGNRMKVAAHRARQRAPG